MPIRTLIVDDEPLARARILRLLNNDPDLLVIGECGNGQEAIRVIQGQQPDLLFLDIQMPVIDGFAVLRQIDRQQLPCIIFVTAYDQYALKAFEVCALDYLLKPFDNDRFFDSLKRAKEQIRLRKAQVVPQKLLPLLGEIQPVSQVGVLTFEVRRRNQVKTIRPEAMYWLKASGNYAVIHLEAEQYPYRATMERLETMLKPHGFLRVHRSYLLNTRFIHHVRYLGNHEYRFTLTNRHELISGRSYYAAVQAHLNRNQAGE